MKRRNFLKIQREKDHKQGKFSNPFFRQRKLKKAKKARRLFILVLLVVIAIPIAVIASPLYRISTADVSGLTTIKEQDVLHVVEEQLGKKRVGVFSQRNRFFLNKKQLETVLQDTYQFSSLMIETKRNSIQVAVEEQISEIVWATGDMFYVLDLDGLVVRTLFDVERDQIHKRLGLPSVPFEEGLEANLPPTIPIIFDNSNAEVLPGTNPINPILVQHIIDFDKSVRLLFIHPKTYGVDAPGTPWMRVDTDQSYDVLFDGTQGVQEQVSVLQSVLQGTEDLSIEEYIDIRFANRAYTR